MYLEHNQVTKLPDTIGNLSKLKILALQNNPIQELPKCIECLTSLDAISIDSTLVKQLSQLHLPNLRLLYIAGEIDDVPKFDFSPKLKIYTKDNIDGLGIK